MRILSEIHIYPVKSLGGIALDEARVETFGLQHDRRWMLVDRDGRFVSQREIPAMVLLGTAIEPGHLVVFVKNKPAESIRIPLNMSPETRPALEVAIWGDRCEALVLPDAVSEWFSDHLHQSLRLVHMPDSTRRWADGRYAPPGQYVSFADGYPILIIGQATLDDLNSRMEQPLPMERFRPNFVFTGGEAFEEDNWREFDISGHRFLGVKPCARCIMPTIDQQTGERAAEPLKTLNTFRKQDNKILFGQNVVWLGGDDGMVRTGDLVKV
jgi:hypothetical protein